VDGAGTLISYHYDALLVCWPLVVWTPPSHIERASTNLPRQEREGGIMWRLYMFGVLQLTLTTRKPLNLFRQPGRRIPILE
jgi:hypothetical protein